MQSLFVPLLIATAISNPAVSDQAVSQPTPKDGPKNAAEIRKLLDEKITLDFEGDDLDAVVSHLYEKFKLAIWVDSVAMVQTGNVGRGAFGGFAGIGGMFGGAGLFGGNFVAPGQPGFPANWAAAGLIPKLHLKGNNEKLRDVLKNFLSKGQVTYVILTDKIVITTEERGNELQLGQRVGVDAKDRPLGDVLQKLADDTGVNLLIDPRESSKMKSKVSLQLNDVSVETALRLLTALADVSIVSVGNVVFVTSEGRAEKLRKENMAKKNAGAPASNPFGGGG